MANSAKGLKTCNPKVKSCMYWFSLLVFLFFFNPSRAQSVRKTISKVEANQAQGAFNENIPLLEAALLKRPDDPDLLMLQIRNDLGLGKKSRADSIFLNRKILFFDEDYINFFIDRSYATGNYSSVVSACRSKKVKKKVEILGWDKYFLSIVNLGKIDSLEFFAEQYIQENDDHYLGYYYKGVALEKRGIMERAKTEYNRSLYHIETIPEVKNYALACIYSGLGRLYFHYKLLDLALENCESALKADSALFDMVLMRSRILVLKDRYVDAQKSLSRALSMDPENSICLKLIFYNSIKLNKPELALSYVKQLGKVVALNDSLLYERAKLLLSCKKYLDAYNDCKNLKGKGLKFPELETTMKNAKVDRVPPLLVIQKPGTDTIKYGTNEKRINFEIFASDKTGLIRFTFNDSIINLNLDSAFVFKQTVVVNKYKSLSFSVVDAFDNITQINIPIKVDFSEPTVEVVFPQLLHGKSLVPENPEDMYVFLELSLSDNNRIETLLVNGVEKMITQKSQTKSYEKISIDKLDSIVVEVEDEMGNWAREAYFIDREKARENQRNPMGKTFVLIITNSNYQNLKELNGPASDARILKSCLMNYLIDSIIHFENLTLSDFKKIINTDVALWVNKYHIKSLLIWYGGHGSYSEFHNSGYWIPVDATSNDFDNYYSLTELKIMLSSYKKLNHLLLISDACQTGQSFYSKSILKSSSNPCGDWQLTKMRSAECFTSSDSQLSSDNSIFARTFTKVLQSDPSDCIGMLTVAEKVSEIVRQNQTQSPIFGNITGMESENGSFVFIKRSYVNRK